MGDGERTGDEGREIARLRDELEQLRTALEASSDEVSRLAEDRDRLMRRVTDQARDLQAANTAYTKAATSHRLYSEAGTAAQVQSDQDQEELRVAFEEMQVLTEELETANNSLHETNKALDRRVEERTRELEMKNQALVKSELRFRTLVEGMPQLVWRAATGGTWTWSSPQWTAYTGLSMEESAGWGWLCALHPDDRAPAQSAWLRAEADTSLDLEARIFHQAEGRYRHFRTRATAALADNGRIVEWLGTSTDVDDLLRLRERQGVLVAELQHRTRNLITVVRALSERTLGNAISIEDFRDRFNRRLAALSRVQGLLSHLSAGQRVTFGELLGSELAALDAPEDKVTLDGPPDISLRSATVQTFALAIHELATNALKYGALAVADGHLTVRWSVVSPADNESPHLAVDWREAGVATSQVSPRPGGRGYGRELIERALPYQLNAVTTYALTENGVHCTIDVPLAAAKT